MSRETGPGVSEDVCHHCHTVDNERDGESVCTDCGLVLTQLFFPSGGGSWQPAVSLHHDLPSLQQQQRWEEEEEEEAEEEVVAMHRFIADVSANAQISNCVMRHAVQYYDEIRKWSSCRCFSKETLASYALYESLNKFGVPRLAEEIEYYTGVKRKSLWQVETHVTSQSGVATVHDPVHFVSRYCDVLELSYPEQLMIRETVACLNSTPDIPLGNLHCNCLVAVVIYLFCKDRKTTMKKKNKVSLESICEVCTISATSIHRVIRQMRQLTPMLAKHPQLACILRALSSSSSSS